LNKKKQRKIEAQTKKKYKIKLDWELTDYETSRPLKLKTPLIYSS